MTQTFALSRNSWANEIDISRRGGGTRKTKSDKSNFPELNGPNLPIFTSKKARPNKISRGNPLTATGSCDWSFGSTSFQLIFPGREQISAEFGEGEKEKGEIVGREEREREREIKIKSSWRMPAEDGKVVWY